MEFDKAPLGWRYLSNEGKHKEAFALIDAYVSKNSVLIEKQWRERKEGEEALPPEIFSWHKGQLLAEIGENKYASAISEFDKSRMIGREDWNAYVDASIAFLKQDSVGLAKALAEMEAIETKKSKCHNIEIVRNFSLALAEGNHSYEYAYGLER